MIIHLIFSQRTKTFALTRLEVFADDKLQIVEIMISVFDRVENMGKGENAGYQYFLLFPQCFPKLYLCEVL